MSAHSPDPPPFPPFPVSGTERLYDSSWCSLRRDRIEVGNGREQDYHVLEVADAVCIVPVLPDGSIVMLWQLRHPHGRTHWEVPAGRVDEGETPEAAAARELLEETGHRAGTLERACSFYPVNGLSAHRAHLFLALDCRQVAEPRPDPSERIHVQVMSACEARRRLLAGELEDAFTALALFHHFARVDSRNGGPAR